MPWHDLMEYLLMEVATGEGDNFRKTGGYHDVPLRQVDVDKFNALYRDAFVACHYAVETSGESDRELIISIRLTPEVLTMPPKTPLESLAKTLIPRDPGVITILSRGLFKATPPAAIQEKFSTPFGYLPIDGNTFRSLIYASAEVWRARTIAETAAMWRKTTRTAMKLLTGKYEAVTYRSSSYRQSQFEYLHSMLMSWFMPAVIKLLGAMGYQTEHHASTYHTVYSAKYTQRVLTAGDISASTRTFSEEISALAMKYPMMKIDPEEFIAAVMASSDSWRLAKHAADETSRNYYRKKFCDDKDYVINNNIRWWRPLSKMRDQTFEPYRHYSEQCHWRRKPIPPIKCDREETIYAEELALFLEQIKSDSRIEIQHGFKTAYSYDPNRVTIRCPCSEN